MPVGEFKYQLRRDVGEESRNVDEPPVKIELGQAIPQGRRADAPLVRRVDRGQNEFVHG